MKFNPLVSVIVPCYNYGRFLVEALDSVLLQTYCNWECIIVNDGSTDNSEKIGLEYQNLDSRFIYIFQKNGGHHSARNTALKASKGKYIQFLDADDMIENQKLHLQVSLMEENHHIDLVYSDVLAFQHADPQRKFSSPTFFTRPPATGKGEVIIENLIPNVFFIPGCVIMKKSVYEKVGTMKSSYAHEDWEFFVRMALEGFYFYHDPRKGVKLLSRTHGDNTTHKAMEMIKSKIFVRKEIIKVTYNYIKDNRLALNEKFISQLFKEHKRLLINDQAMYNMYIQNYTTGVKYVFLDAFYSGKPLHAFINGGKWFYYGLKKAFG